MVTQKMVEDREWLLMTIDCLCDENDERVERVREAVYQSWRRLLLEFLNQEEN